MCPGRLHGKPRHQDVLEPGPRPDHMNPEFRQRLQRARRQLHDGQLGNVSPNNAFVKIFGTASAAVIDAGHQQPADAADTTTPMNNLEQSATAKYAAAGVLGVLPAQLPAIPAAGVRNQCRTLLVQLVAVQLAAPDQVVPDQRQLHVQQEPGQRICRRQRLHGYHGQLQPGAEQGPVGLRPAARVQACRRLHLPIGNGHAFGGEHAAMGQRDVRRMGSRRIDDLGERRA